MSKKNNRNNNGKITNQFNRVVNTYIPAEFKNLRQEFGLDPIRNKTSNANKLESQRENFKSKYKCKLCGEHMEWIRGTNMMICKNEKCKGYPVKNKAGEVVAYRPSVFQLTARGAEIAETLFG